MADADSIFLSYGHDDNEEIVFMLKKDMEKAGFTVWVDTSKIKAGDDWRESIVIGISGSRGVLAALSKHSVRDPGVCLDELRIASGMPSCRILTVLLEAPDVQPPLTVSHIQYVDMSAWREKKAQGTAVFATWYEEKKQALLEALLKERDVAGSVTRLRELLMPALDANSYLNRMDFLLRQRVVGRAWMLKRLEQWLEDEQAGKVFCLTGEQGIGKSVMAALIASHSKLNVVGVHFCQRGSNFDTPEHVFRQLAFQMATRLPSYRAYLLASPFDWKTASAKDIFLHALVRAAHGSIDGGRMKHFLLIDALDEAPTELAALLAELSAELPPWLRLVLTSRLGESCLQPYLKSFAPIQLDASSPENLDDVNLYLRDWTKSKHISPEDRERFCRDLLAASAGNFRYVSFLLDSFDNPASPLGLKEYLSGKAAFPAGLARLYSDYFKRIFPDTETYERNIRPLLDVLSVAALPVPMPTLERAMDGCMDGTDLRKRLKRLGSVAFSDASRARLYHRSVQDWLLDVESCGEYAVKSAIGHELLAKALIGETREACAEQSFVTPFCQCSLPEHVRAVASTRDGSFSAEKLAALGVEASLLQDARAFLGRDDQVYYSNWQAQASYKDWVIFWRDVASAVFGGNALQTAVLNAEVAEEMRMNGNYFKACCTLEESLHIFVSALGLEHSSTLACLKQLGRALTAGGEYSAARARLEQCLALLQKNYPDDHTAITSVQRHLANCLRHLGNHAEAAELCVSIIEQEGTTFPEDDPDGLQVRRSLAHCLMGMGKYDQACAICEKNLEYCRKNFGNDDYRTMINLDSMADALRYCGQYHRSYELYKTVQDHYTNMWGSNHPWTLGTERVMAVCLRQAGEYAKARALLEKNLSAFRARFGPEHPETLNAQCSLANCLVDMKYYSEAYIMFTEYHDILNKVYGPQHPDTINVYTNLGVCLQYMNKLSQARAMYERGVTLSDEVLGPLHPNTLMVKANLAVLLMDMGELGAAFELNRQCLELRLENLGSEHPDTLNAQNNLASTLMSMGEWQEARALLEKCWQLLKNTLGDEHPNTLTALKNLAKCRRQLKETEAACAAFELYLESLRKRFGDEHPDVLSAMRTLAECRQNMAHGDTAPTLASAQTEPHPPRLKQRQWRQKTKHQHERAVVKTKKITVDDFFAPIEQDAAFNAEIAWGQAYNKIEEESVFSSFTQSLSRLLGAKVRRDTQDLLLASCAREAFRHKVRGEHAAAHALFLEYQAQSVVRAVAAATPDAESLRALYALRAAHFGPDDLYVVALHKLLELQNHSD